MELCSPVRFVIENAVIEEYTEVIWSFAGQVQHWNHLFKWKADEVLRPNCLEHAFPDVRILRFGKVIWRQQLPPTWRGSYSGNHFRSVLIANGTSPPQSENVSRVNFRRNSLMQSRH